MQLDKIITLANSKVRLRFLALERSLRSVGCDLPLWVIPYDDNKFELPPNATWWEVSEITEWLKSYKTHAMMRKYQCLTTGNYQFVDSDIIFLVNPESALQKASGFVTSCGHWHNPGHTYTSQSLELLRRKSTSWQKSVFNAGQFACDQSLYSITELKTKSVQEDYKYTCLLLPYHDQPGMNLLVNTSGVTINNLTLPPYNMESTWAGDYQNEEYEKLWKGDKKPYLIHWAGCNMEEKKPIDELFYSYLTQAEKKEWAVQMKENFARKNSSGKYLLALARKFKKYFKR